MEAYSLMGPRAWAWAWAKAPLYGRAMMEMGCRLGPYIWSHACHKFECLRKDRLLTPKFISVDKIIDGHVTNKQMCSM